MIVANTNIEFLIIDQLMYHCGGECIPITNDAISCTRHNIEYYSNSTGIFESCNPISNDTCITNLENCLSQAKNGVLLIGLCSYRVTQPLRQQSEIKCDSEGRNTWLNSCTTLVVLQSQSLLYNTTNPSE